MNGVPPSTREEGTNKKTILLTGRTIREKK
jgi:hypothetical protein